MRNFPPAYRRLLAVYGVLGLLLWSVPLLAILHAESSAIVAAVAFFGAGLSTKSLLERGEKVRRILLLQEAALLIPWVLLTVSAFWQPNCGYLQGLIFFFLFPVITVLLAVGLMTFLTVALGRRTAFIFAVLGLLMIAVPPIFDVGFHPQFYTYNHVFGGILGPIYDERLSVRPGLFAFRGLTVLWSLFFLLCSALLQRNVNAFPAAVTAAAIGISYAFAPDLGFVTTYEKIQEELGAVRQTPHFDIYYDPEVLSENDLNVIAESHEFQYDRLSYKLAATVNDRIDSYIYPDADVKGRLTGSHRTNVAPVWLNRPQTHVLYPAFEQVFPHELAHVFSREFGLPIINASVSVGLIEGLAVALEPPDGLPNPREQISAAILSETGGAREALARSSNLSRSIADRLSPFGFWTSRGAVSYTAMGSFVAYLLEAYGAESLKRVYAWADFEDVYGKPAKALASEWAEYVFVIDAVARSSEELVSARFKVPSLFEEDCPHFVPSHERYYSKARTALIRGDTLFARRLLEQSLSAWPNYTPALEAWAGLEIVHGDLDVAASTLRQVPFDSLSAPLLVHLGDAFVLQRNPVEGLAAYSAAIHRVPAHAQEFRSLVLLRLAVIDRPNILRVYLRADTNEVDPPLKEEHGDSVGHAAKAFLALRAAREDRYEQALDLLRTTSAIELVDAVPFLGQELVRRRLAWLARFAYRSRDFFDAAAYADSAAAAYRAAGALNEADVQEEFRARIGWLAAKEMEQIARTTSF